MAGEKLHRFDLQLCRYALDNVGSYMDNPAFAAYVEKRLAPPVLTYLRALDAEDAPPRLLLSERELDVLAQTFQGAPLGLDRPWVPYESLHRRSIECVKEIRDGLAAEYVQDWARASATFSEQLEAGRRVRLGNGIEVVGAWVGEARRYLRVMGAMAWLPAPEGSFPTPTHPGPPPTSAPARQGPEAQQEENVARLQQAIAELGPDAKADDLIRNAGIARKPGRDALRELQQRGQYRGFARGRPYRYRQGQPGEK
jgi:hypothetical protein